MPKAAEKGPIGGDKPDSIPPALKPILICLGLCGVKQAAEKLGTSGKKWRKRARPRLKPAVFHSLNARVETLASLRREFFPQPVKPRSFWLAFVRAEARTLQADPVPEKG